ncbi:hypothetical protein IGI71_002818 [Enterococcus sp. DIV1279b]|uniref:hypothetical protein n=1 Tax=Enterococcus sp. DIV1279b TaxID=2774663 RepID=UPI003D2FC81C
MNEKLLKKNTFPKKISGKTGDFYLFGEPKAVSSNENMDEFIERSWFTGFCNESEIDRILNPQNGNDYILQKRANIVADNARFTRVYCAKARSSKNWSFEKSFAISHYNNFLKSLSNKDKALCEQISFGNMFSDDLNGYAENNQKFGKIIYLNESLYYFIYYMSLALLNFEIEIPYNIRMNSLRIAMRIFLKTEAMDFSLDPRGKVPNKISKKIKKNIAWQLQFIVGHEFSHHLCNHLDKRNLIRLPFYTSIDGIKYESEFFNLDQKKEFEADINSLMLPKYNKFQFQEVYSSSLLWFIFLDVGESMMNQIRPSFHSYRTHPNPLDRLVKILEEVPKPDGFDKSGIDLVLQTSELFKDFLLEDLSLNCEAFETYGSAYLDEPNTDWRGRKLFDRVDY